MRESWGLNEWSGEAELECWWCWEFSVRFDDPPTSGQELQGWCWAQQGHPIPRAHPTALLPSTGNSHSPAASWPLVM